jgi:SPP1 gp7 family putative phage head morphogenesis protein
MMAVKKSANEKVLRAVHPNVGIECAFRRKLRAMIDDMHASTCWYVSAAYKQNEPHTLMAADAPPDAGGFKEPRPQSPAVALREAVRKLAKRWQRNFNDAAPRLAEYFATAAAQRSDAALRQILKDGGFSVEFKMTRAARDVLNATVAQNVSLIKSIPQKYLADVEQMVMRSIQTGRDLGSLTKELEEAYGVTRKRAALIAHHQNNAATSAMTRARQVELNIESAEWRHSHAGRFPRPTHVAMNGKRYDPKVGMYDPAEGRNVFPGELIRCRCTSRSVIAGF